MCSCVCEIERMCPLSDSSAQVALVSNWTQNGSQLARSLSLPLALSLTLTLAPVRNGNELTLMPLPPCHLSPSGQTVEKFSQIEKETKCRSILARALSSCCANIISNFSRYFSYLSSSLNFLPTVHFDLRAINTKRESTWGALSWSWPRRGGHMPLKRLTTIICDICRVASIAA